MEDGPALTTGQLAHYVGVPTKTVRVYHSKGLLPEPDRDARLSTPARAKCATRWLSAEESSGRPGPCRVRAEPGTLAPEAPIAGIAAGHARGVRGFAFLLKRVSAVRICPGAQSVLAGQRRGVGGSSSLRLSPRPDDGASWSVNGQCQDHRQDYPPVMLMEAIGAVGQVPARPWYIDWLIPLAVSLIALGGVIWSGRSTARSLIEAETKRDELANAARARERAAERRQFLRDTVADVARTGRERSHVASLHALGLLKDDALDGLDPQLGERNRRAAEQLSIQVDRIRLTIVDTEIQDLVDAVWAAHLALQAAMEGPFEAVLKRGKAEGADLRSVHIAAQALDAAVEDLVKKATEILAEPVQAEATA